MTAQGLTSVVMVTYYTGPALDQAIASVLAQTTDVELIIVNNGNPPEVEAGLVSRFKDEPSVRLMTGHGNIGFARASNLGARVASGDHILFSGADCVLPADAILRLYEQEKLINRAYMIGARLVDGKGQEQPCSRRAAITPKTIVVEALHLEAHFPAFRTTLYRDPLPEKLAPVSSISRSFMFMKKKDLVYIKGFDEGYFYGCEDMDLCLRFIAKGGQVLFDPNIVVKVLGSKEGFSIENEKVKAKDAMRYFNENFGDSYFHPFLWFLYAVIWLRALVRMCFPFLQEKKKFYAAQAKAKALSNKNSQTPLKKR